MGDQPETSNWVLSSDASDYILDTCAQIDTGVETLAIIRGLRKSLTSEQARAAFEMADLRIRARQKFSLGDKMYFTRPALEMATSQPIAAYKAKRFQGLDSVADYCCGIGGDLIAMVAVSEPNMGIDSDPFMVSCANKNLHAHGFDSCAQIGLFGVGQAKTFSAIHIDPERRTAGRSTKGQHFSPPLDEVLALAIEHSVGIKVAPATRIDTARCGQFELAWIGHRRECKQQMIWSGELARNPGHKLAVSLDSSCNNVFSCSIKASENCRPIYATSIADFCYEPHNCVLAARLEDSLAAEFNLHKFSADAAYFTSDKKIQHGLLSAFETLDVLPAKPKSVGLALTKYEFSELEIKKRGVPESFAQTFKKLKLGGATPLRGTLILSVLGNKRIAIIARRLT